MRILSKLFLPCVLVSIFSACGTSDILQSKVAEPQVYIIKPEGAGAAQVAFNSQLAIALPTATPGLDTDHIAVLRDGNHLDYYFGVRWGAAAPIVVQSFVVSLLQSQQGFKSVVAEAARVDAEYLLEISLTDFQAEYGSATAPTVHITLVANLINIKQRKSSSLLRTSATVAARENHVGAVVTAFQSALQQAATSLSAQVTATVGK